MKGIHITGISRQTKFSPNHIDHDAAIFQGVVDFLEDNGCPVSVCSEEDFLGMMCLVDPVVLTMMRSDEALAKLQNCENKGALAVNSAFGISHCKREALTRILLEKGIPYPESVIVDTDDLQILDVWKERWTDCWVKRADCQPVQKEDVAFVSRPDDLDNLLHGYVGRGIKRAVISRHLPGDLIKFYGVAGTDFFYWFYPQKGHRSKFGLEAINGDPRGLRFDRLELHDICSAAASALSVDVYGGDCVVSENGDIRLIDFNDWPSFAPCRNEAMVAIGQLVLNKIK